MTSQQALSRNLQFSAFMRGVLVISAIVLGALSLAGSAAAQGIAIPSYATPGSKTWNTWAASPQAVKIMIINADNGDDTTFSSSTLAAVHAAQSAGITVLAYTYTEYGERNPATVMQKIAAAETNYLVNGIFLDQAPTSCTAATPFSETNLQYYQNLSNYIHTQYNGVVVMNPGTPPPTNCWMTAADILVTWENSGLTSYQHSYAEMSWMQSYPANRFWNLLYSVSKQKDMQTAFSLAAQRNVGLIYVTSAGGSNPWDSIPSYWSAEVSQATQK